MLEAHEDGAAGVHGEQDRGAEAGGLQRGDGGAEAEVGDDVHGHAPEGVVEVGRAVLLRVGGEGRAEGVDLGADDGFAFGDGGRRERLVEDVLAGFGLAVGEEAEGGAVFAEAVVEVALFVPAVLVVVDVVVGLRVGEVELWWFC